MSKILICSDLDRTLLPNGAQPHSPEALPILRTLAAREEITLAYVSGRDEALLKKAIDEFDIPVPDYAIGDVGTTIYCPREGWHPWQEWSREIAGDWRGRSREDLEKMFADIDALDLQEPAKQNTFKLSYYSDARGDHEGLVEELERRLAGENIEAGVIWSVDEEKNVGLIDILPKNATKVHAIRFLMEKQGFSRDRTVFAGDSGNDMGALTSGLNAILVKNAMAEVREEAVAAMGEKGMPGRLYLARGGFLGMNGNYSAGVLEGVAHFFPETREWMQTRG